MICPNCERDIENGVEQCEFCGCHFAVVLHPVVAPVGRSECESRFAKGLKSLFRSAAITPVRTSLKNAQILVSAEQSAAGKCRPNPEVEKKSGPANSIEQCDISAIAPPAIVAECAALDSEPEAMPVDEPTVIKSVLDSEMSVSVDDSTDADIVSEADSETVASAVGQPVLDTTSKAPLPEPIVDEQPVIAVVSEKISVEKEPIIIGVDADKVVRCGNCDKEIKPGVAFCKWCGAPIAAGIDTVKCRKCGKTINRNAPYCKWCGNKNI